MIGFLTRSIPRRILAALLGIYAATYFATAIVVYSGARASLLESNAGALNQLADLKYDQLANAIDALGTDLAAWSQLDVMNDLVSGDIDKRVAQTLDALKRNYRLSGNIYAFDTRGRLIASSRPAPIGGPVGQLPPQWQDAGRQILFVDKQADPMTGKEIVALVSPVFGSFDRSYRVGTLVLTYPWSSIERLLFSLQTGTILIEMHDGGTRILAANPAQIATQASPNGNGDIPVGRSSGFIVGRSLPKTGLINGWAVVTLQQTDVALRPLSWISFDLLLLGLFLAIPIAFLGRWLSQRLTAPIADLTRVVREIANTDNLDARVPVMAADELGSLAQSFNIMIENLKRTTREREQFVGQLAALNETLERKIGDRTRELEAAIRAQQRLLGDISHEIKSPLARLSMALGLARRSPGDDAARQFDRIEREIENISALTTELLTLARLDQIAAAPEFAEVNLDELVARIVADAMYEHPDRGADIVVCGAGEPSIVAGSADLLRRAIENVVRNAIFYTAPRTQIEILLSRKPNQTITLEVRDAGPGVPSAALAHLFEPFYRVDDARARETGGSGIGLAICQRVVQLHRGSVRARPNEPSGLVVEIDLPGAS